MTAAFILGARCRFVSFAYYWPVGYGPIYAL